MTMSVFVYDAVDLCKYSTKKIYVMFSLKCMSSGQKILRESLYRTILWSLFHLLKGMSVRMEHATASSASSDAVELRLQELRSSAVTRGREWLQDALANISVMELRKMAHARNVGRGPDNKWLAVGELRAQLLDVLAPRMQVRWGRIGL